MAGTRIPIAGPGEPAKTLGAIAIAREISGDAAAPEEITWETEGGLSCALEIVIQLVGLTGTITPFNMCDRLRWQVWSWSHGEATFQPAPNLSQSTVNPGAQVQFPQWAFIARGVVARLSARSIRIVLANTQAASSALIRASIHPLNAPDSDRWPFPNFDAQPSAGGRGFFPIGAREWRVQPQGPNDLISTYAWSNDAAPSVLDTQPSQLYTDWSPIGVREFSWTSTANNQLAEYR